MAVASEVSDAQCALRGYQGLRCVGKEEAGQGERCFIEELVFSVSSDQEVGELALHQHVAIVWP